MARIIILFFACLWLSSAFAQPGNKNDLASLLSTTGQKIIRTAIDSSVCIIEQDYILVDSSGEQYGRNNNHFFGRLYTVGIISDSGIYTSSEVLNPWQNDKEYIQFKDKPNLKPALSKTWFKRASDSSFIDIKNNKMKVSADSAVLSFSLPDSIRYIPSAVSQTMDSTGWLMVVSNKMNASSTGKMPYSFYVFKPKIAMHDSSSIYRILNTIAVAADENIIGGAYFTCQVSIGHIVFFANGILKKDNTGWFINRLTGIAVNQNEKEKILTPIDTK